MALDHRDERETLRAKRDSSAGTTGRGADRPADDSLKDTLLRTFRKFSADSMTDWAGALTYYGIQALFPALIALVSIIGLIGGGLTDTLLDNVNDLAPGPAREILADTIRNLAKSEGAAGVFFVVGVLLALNAASAYVGAFTRASNVIYDVAEGRPVWKLKPQQIGITLVMVLSIVAVTAMVAVTGPLAEQVGTLIGAGDAASTVWDIAKIPVVLLLVISAFGFLYRAAPNVKQPSIGFFSAGGFLALGIWIAASFLFAFYVASFASYNKTYGSLGGAVVFLIWLWLTNVAILMGAELNCELQRSRHRQAGQPAPFDTPFLEPRDVTKLEKKAAEED